MKSEGATEKFEEPEQIAIRCSIVRGGTSKGVFFLEHDLPPAGKFRDAVLKRVMGTPDIMQIDGLGGTHYITSKIAIIGRSTHADADVDYTFVQAEIHRDVLDYTRSCGNISSGVGPFAIDAGLVRAQEPVTPVRIHSTNTGKIIIGHIPVRNGRARVTGDYAIDGVPGTGAEIVMDYRLTAGARTGKVLPSGRLANKIELEDGSVLDAMILDIACACVFVRAGDVGIQGSETPAEIKANSALVRKLIEIRGKAAVLAGLASDWTQAETQSPSAPFIVMVSPPRSYTSRSGAPVDAAAMDLCARFMYLNECHPAMAGTGSVCIAGAARIPGSLVNEMVAAGSRKDTLEIGHPSGVMQVHAAAHDADNELGVAFDKLGYGRTARKIMDGTVYIPAPQLG